MWLIVGLGNPGEEYAGTYHNVGFRVVSRLADREKVRLNERCGPALIYMNQTGTAIPPVFERFGATPHDVIVIYDDVALPLGKIRVRQKGSAGGHNGIKSLVSAFGSDEFLRIRVGIKPEREIVDLREFVLSQVSKDDRELLQQAEEVTGRAVETLISEGIDEAMRRYNGIDLREEEN